MVVFMYFLAKDAILLISSSEFISTADHYGSDTVLFCLCLALAFSFFSSLFSFSLVAFGKQSRMLWTNGIGALFNVIANLIFIPLYGFMGAAIVAIVSEFLIVILTHHFLQKTHRFTWELFKISKTALSASLMFLVLYPLHEYLQPGVLRVAILGVLGVLVYGISLKLFKVLDREKIASLRDLSH